MPGGCHFYDYAGSLPAICIDDVGNVSKTYKIPANMKYTRCGTLYYFNSKIDTWWDFAEYFINHEVCKGFAVSDNEIIINVFTDRVHGRCFLVIEKNKLVTRFYPTGIDDPNKIKIREVRPDKFNDFWYDEYHLSVQEQRQEDPKRDFDKYSFLLSYKYIHSHTIKIWFTEPQKIVKRLYDVAVICHD